MARAPDSKAEKAKELYLSGKKLIEISEILDVPEGTIRSWKNRYKWGSDNNATLQNEKRKTQRCNRKKRNAANTDKLLIDSVLENTDLTGEQQLFCVFYAKTLNATQSYKNAYGCSYETALRAGPRLLGNVGVKKEINRLKKERFENQLFDEHDIFQWYLDIATACVTDYVDFGREQVPVMNMFGPVVDKKTKQPIMKEINYVKFRPAGEVDGRAIKKIKMGKDGASIELYDAMAAMDWLANHMSMGTAGQQGLAQSIINSWKEKDTEPAPSSNEEDRGDD